MGGVPFCKSTFLVSCARTCHDPVGHTSNSTVITCTDDITEHTEDEGLDKQRWQELELPGRTSVREKFSPENWSASNALTSRSNKKSAGNKTKRKVEHFSTTPRVMMVAFHLWNERLVFTSEEVPSSEEVFASIAELCLVDFSLSPLL